MTSSCQYNKVANPALASVHFNYKIKYIKKR